MENMETMKKSMLEVKYNLSKDMDFVYNVEDEATKNHPETDQNIQTS